MKTKKPTKPKHGDLRVWWIPQVPMKAFTFDVASLLEAKVLLEALAEYDGFQFENNIKPDYANAGGLSVFIGSEDDWCDWYSSEGDEIDSFTLEQCRECPPEWEGVHWPTK
jgi:hypothetical protein